MSRKRAREQPNVDVELIEIFEDLANEDGEIRIKAAGALLSKTSYENHPSTQQLDKILRRLVRGLCSGRKAARLGFSVALAEFLDQILGSSNGYTAIGNVSDIVAIIQKETQLVGNVSGQEERDHYLGRLFSAEAIIQSKILFRLDHNIDCWEIYLDFICLLAKKKSWLRMQCGWVLYKAVKLLSSQNVSITYVQSLLDKLHSNGLIKTPEGVVIWIAVSSIFLTAQKPKGIWTNDDPLNPDEKLRLAHILKEASVEISAGEDQFISQNGTWNSKLHFAWDVIVETLLSEDTIVTTRHHKRMTFADFWVEAVDNSLFAVSSSDERKYWGFLLFQRYVQVVPSSTLAVLFSPNFMRCLINQTASTQRYLHRSAEESLKAVHQRTMSEPNVAAVIVERLIGSDGNIRFDIVTKSKTVERLLNQLDIHALEMVISMLDKMVIQPRAPNDRNASINRQVLADYLYTIVKSKSNQNQSGNIAADFHGVISKILCIFISHAYFDIRDDPQLLNSIPTPLISQASREMFRSRIMSCLAHLMLKARDTTYFPYYVFSQIHARRGSNNGTFVVFHADQGVDGEINHACKTLEKIREKEKSTNEIRESYFNSFDLLYSILLLQVYNGDADAVNILSELKECYKHLLKRPNADKQGESFEVLVEIILGLLSKTSVLFKQLAQQVFSTFASDITVDSLLSLVRVLETKESISGQADIFEGPNDELDDLHRSDMDESSGTNDDVSVSDNDESKGQQSSSSAGDEDDDELAAFDAKLAQALGTRPGNTDFTAEENESSDEDMNDEQMEALDEHIENMFRDRKKATGKKEKKDAKESIVQLKLRVLDLLDIYIKQQHLNVLAIKLIMPLVRLIHSTTNKLISEKACGLLKKYSKAYKLKDKISFESHKDAHLRSDQLKLLDTIHSAAQQEGSNAHGSACSQASILVAKIFIANGGDVAEVLTRYADLHARVDKDEGCPVKSSFFQDWSNWWRSASAYYSKGL